MTWVVAGFVYAAGYAGLALALAAHPTARLWAGNLGLLVSPLVPIGVILRRRRQWQGRELVFWDAIAVGCALWLTGQIAWAFRELFLVQRLPWLEGEIVLQLSGSTMPLLALVAWPHRGPRRASAATAALDLYALACVAAFLFWSLVVAPGLTPRGGAFAVELLAVIGPGIRLAAAAGLAAAAWHAGAGPWRQAYERLAIGVALSLVLLAALSTAVVQGAYQTGSPLDVGWIVPFWCFAWAAAAAPASAAERHRSIAELGLAPAPAVLFAALATVPVVGYGLRYLVPLGDPVDHYRGVATALALTGGLVLVMARVGVERRVLRSTNRRLQLLASALEQNHDLVVISQGDRVRYANEAFCAALGYSREEVDRLGAGLVAEESRSEAARILEVVGSGRVARGTIQLARHDGSRLTAGYVVAPLADPAGRAPHRVGIFRDLADDIQLRERIVQSERMSAIGDLVIGVAHELNNPLQSVVGHLDLAMTQPIAPEIREDLDRVRFEATRAGRILRNLLAFVRKSPQQRVLADLNELVQEALAASAYELRRARIEVREQYNRHLPLVHVNREELQQLVGNVVVNALQAILSTGRPGVLGIRTHVCGVDAVLEIADDGGGVPPEVGGRVFEPFFTTKDIGESRGLGLSIAHGIATAHGGRLELVPVPTGACFRLTLPGAGFPGPAYIH